MPKGIGYMYGFQMVSPISFHLFQGAPLLLYLKHLGATETILGIAVSFLPLLDILQVPSAHFVERVGYRKFVLRGWTARTLVILGSIAAVTLPGLGAPTRMALLLFFLFLYNFARGVAVTAFLPWETQLVPPSFRGMFVTRDQMLSRVASVGVLCLTACFLAKVPPEKAFGWVFLASLLFGAASLFFLSRVPDVPVPHESKRETPPSWSTMWRNKPFRSLLIYACLMNCAFAAQSVFWVPMFRDHFHFSGPLTLLLDASAGMICILTLPFVGGWLDRTGSKPVLEVAVVLSLLHLLGWAALASGFATVSGWWIAGQQVTGGTGMFFCNAALMRMAMMTIPEKGRSHFFAMYSMLTSLILGFFPVVWGVVLDSLTGWSARWLSWQWNKFSLMYVVLAANILLAQFFFSRLEEPAARSVRSWISQVLLRSPWQMFELVRTFGKKNKLL